MRSHCITFALSLVVAGCASTVDGAAARGDGGLLTDVLPGLNPDALDPFRPVEAGVITADGALVDASQSTFVDATVFDQRYGTLSFGSNPFTLGEYTVIAATFRYLPYPDDPRCGQRSAGAWDFSFCTSAAAPVDPHPRPFPNPGVIDLTGGLSEMSLRPEPAGQYPLYFIPTTVFPGPRAVRVRAPGTREIPAFDLTFMVPPTVVVTSPPGAGEMVVDRSRDLVVEWVPNGAREVWVGLSLYETVGDETRRYRVAVQTHGDVGRAVLPARALAELPASLDGETILTVLPYNISTSRIGSWPLTTTVVGQGRRYTVTLR